MRRQWIIALVAAIFVVTGAVGLLADLWPLVTPARAQQVAKLRADGLADLLPAWGLHLLAIAGGIALWSGRRWAKWLLAVWMAAHVVISLFHSIGETLVHCAIFGVISYLLFARERKSAV